MYDKRCIIWEAHLDLSLDILSQGVSLGWLCTMHGREELWRVSSKKGWRLLNTHGVVGWFIMVNPLVAGLDCHVCGYRLCFFVGS